MFHVLVSHDLWDFDLLTFDTHIAYDVYLALSW